MRRPPLRRVFAPVLLLGGAFILQGCVAAVIPLAAGGLLGSRTISDNDDTPAQPADVAARVTVEDVVTAQPPAGAANADLAPVDASIGNSAATATPVGREDELSMPQSSSIAGAAAPASPAAATQASPEYAPGSGFAINQLLSYANQRQIASGKVPDSAILSDRVSLKPEREQCNAITPTVLIDLDPEGGVFDPDSAARPPSGLGVGLARLRVGGVAIAWISANPVEKAESIRLALARTGLDANKEDRLLLLRSPDNRKQELREELAGVTCLIAIAGDTRSDFDELYDYLLNPADARSLEPLIGDGWFLIPQPLLPERPRS